MIISKPEKLTQHLRISVSDKHKAMLGEMSGYYGISQSEVVRQVIEQAYEAMKKAQQSAA